VSADNYEQADIIEWLLTGDVSIQYQTKRDLLGTDDARLRDRIAKEGWGTRFLSCRRSDGHWGWKYYQPKWTSTHYTLVDLKQLAISPGTPAIQQTIEIVLRDEKGTDGGINPSVTIRQSDVCVSGMALNFAFYFKADQTLLSSIVDFLLSQHMADGGFNCRSNSTGAVHSSLHSTISVAEGISKYQRNGYSYRLPELLSAEQESREFVLQHRLFLSDHTGEIIDKKMLMLSYPSRWRYDILRALEYFRSANVLYDTRMDEAFTVLSKKRRKDGRWPVQARHPGASHFEMEESGGPSRWNTLRALRLFQHFGLDIYQY
jgi:hypothetical protein